MYTQSNFEEPANQNKKRHSNMQRNPNRFENRFGIVVVQYEIEQKT